MLCPFCALDVRVEVLSAPLVFAVRDLNPVSPGHTLIVTRRHVPSWFEASTSEQHAILAAIETLKGQLDDEHAPDGYNVGFNAGAAAGQTVMHLHVHVIPRFAGDMDDPRGGVRHVIPGRGNTLRSGGSFTSGGTIDPLAAHIIPLFARANDIRIVAAFVQEAGVMRIRDALQMALDSGARLRLITGDYLNITQASALELLLGWQAVGDADAATALQGRLETRVIEVERLPAATRVFHPKSWIFEGPGFAVAYVGSSNLSRSALDTGIEWNLRVERDNHTAAWRRIDHAFEELWRIARPLDRDFVDAYARRARISSQPLPAGEQEQESLEPPGPPHGVQRDALAALCAARLAGRRRALVVMATGLGKTWLAAFDYAQLWDELGHPPRLLFVAHRIEILRQAALTWRRLVSQRDGGATLRVSFCVGDLGDLSGDLVFASIAKLTRLKDRLANARFDYVVIDEVHHATAGSYRVLDRLDPTFLLGLTATPDRADGGDVLALFDDFVAFRASVSEGIAVGRLVPFRYFGVKDDIDYDHIPWRNRRFDPEHLALAAQTEARMATLWEAWRQHPGTKTLVFCCSVAHALFARAWLRQRGVRVAAVFAGPGSDDREAALASLSGGELDAICAVDVFNEGIDLPMLDRVVMLRPTESSGLFLQQLGRGLRAAVGKVELTVIDFVGNHRMFLERLRTVLSLGLRASTLAGLIAEGSAELGDGCSVELQLEAKPALQALFKVGGAATVERVYRELKLTRDQRPTAGELSRMGYLVRSLRARHGTWFDFVRSEGDLSAVDVAVLTATRAFLDELESAELTSCFKWVTLEALLEGDALTSGLDDADLAAGAWTMLRRSPELLRDVPESERPGDALSDRWTRYWIANGIEPWTTTKAGKRAWFRRERCVFGLALPPHGATAFAALVRELVDYRLAQFRRRSSTPQHASFEGIVGRARGALLLKLPANAARREGDTDVRLPDGAVWIFRFAREQCTAARPAGTADNQLSELLLKWFGPAAGQPGTTFSVRFVASPDGLWIEPITPRIEAPSERSAVVSYPDLQAAAGHAQADIDPPEAELVVLPVAPVDRSVFAVRVAGTSMDGGARPLRDGDWALMQLARGASAESLTGQVALLELPGVGGNRYQIKRVVRHGDGWLLASDNASGPSFEADESMLAVARLERVVRPEDLAPAEGTVLEDAALAPTFGLDDLVATSGRYGGHLFVFVAENRLMSATRLRWDGLAPRPGETAYVLAQSASGWRYLGVGRRSQDETLWVIPEADYDTVKRWGPPREASRTLPDGALSTAQRIVDAVMRVPPSERLLRRGAQVARVVGTASKGGLRIAGLDGGFNERSVTLTDLAWVAVAAQSVRADGGILDEARVNKARYIDGTPKGSTRWIDTGWAIAAWMTDAAQLALVMDQPQHPRRGDGSVVDATFKAELLAGALTLVFESMGGTKGAPGAQNTDYAEGLTLVLERLGRAGAVLTDAAVDSRTTQELPLVERRLVLEEQPYPVALTGDVQLLRKRLSAAQGRVGRAPEASGAGNPTRRIRLWVESPLAPHQLVAVLVGEARDHLA